jgi:hypothetical protein
MFSGMDLGKALDWSSKEIPEGTPCYFCDYRAVKRLKQGHPACHYHYEEFGIKVR